MVSSIDPVGADRAQGTPFINFAAYADGIYSPPPQLVAIAAVDTFWVTLGGSYLDPFGDGNETRRQRAAAARAGISGYASDGSLKLSTFAGEADSDG